MPLYKLMMLTIFCSCFVACGVELRNSHPQDESTSDLVITGPMYIYQGKVIDEETLNAFIDKPDTDNDMPVELKFRNIQISAEGVLYTLGQNVHLVADTLMGEEGAVITTFKSTQAAPEGHAGRPGGKLVIQIQQAQGQVTFAMRGEIGGQGLPGEKADALLAGADGAKIVRLNFMQTNYCAGPIDGQDGQPGKTGYPGHPGFVGGDSGDFQLEVSDTRDFSYVIMKIPGAGGSGGLGGPGGEGGHGGPPADKTCGNLIGKPGKQAAAGPAGPQGVSGAEGRKQPACVVQSGLVLCQ